MEQSLPAQPASQVQVWVVGWRVPCAEHPGRHWRAAGSTSPHSTPIHPLVQMQEPEIQKPWPEHRGSGQSAAIDSLMDLIMCKTSFSNSMQFLSESECFRIKLNYAKIANVK